MDESRQSQVGSFLIDLFMMVVLCVNLAWILFDWIYSIDPVTRFFREELTGFYRFYAPIHRHFFYYDLFFVAVFAAEILIRWGNAVRRHTYHRWFFYPFIHWYDVIGCIPIGAFRFFRVLRIISILYRLQRLQWIDLTTTYPSQFFSKYYDVLTEEISDRVIIKMIESAQQQLVQGSPVVNRVLTEVLRPRKQDLVAWFSLRMQNVAGYNYALHRDDIRRYIEMRVKAALFKNREMKAIETLPVLGDIISQNIEKIVADVAFYVLNDTVEDVASANINKLFDEIAEIIFETLTSGVKGNPLDQALTDISTQAMEIIKEEVRIQQWKIKERDLRGRELNLTPPSKKP